ncbi:DUF2621 domain-containing protein, partial [Mammaliicoccus sciuri]
TPYLKLFELADDEKNKFSIFDHREEISNAKTTHTQ